MTLNPLLQYWETPFGIPPFDKIEDRHFSEALDHTLENSLLEYNRIGEDKQTPTFKNTIESMELAEKQLNDVAGVFFNLSASSSNEMRRNLETEFSPKFARYSSDIILNNKLFQRIDHLWKNRDQLALNPEQSRVLELYHRNFVRSGCGLDEKDRERLRHLREQLASLTTNFSQNILKEENEWYLEVSEDKLDGLPEHLVEGMKIAASEKNLEGYVITLNRSLIVPFLQYSSRRNLREIAYNAWVGRGASRNGNNTEDIIGKILKYRFELARLLGFENYSEYKLEIAMAKSPDKVRNLLEQVWQPAREQAIADRSILQDMLQEDGTSDALKPWDWRYYAEKRRLVEFDYNENQVKKYFQLDLMLEAVFHCANRLFGLTFTKLDVPLYHPDCRAWEVRKDDQHLAVFIGDYFARSGKRSGAWCSAFRSQRNLGGRVRPITVNVCNFVKPEEDEPCLLSFDDTRTLFHEFGHALHSMLSEVTFESISGTSVARDFVELPSQLFEHWMELPDVLTKFGRHAETGEPIPASLLDRVLKARNFDIGFATVEYLASAFVDLELHDDCPPDNPLERAEEILRKIALPPEIKMRHGTSNFSHVFATDGYSSGYYSYMWSEVMDADAFECFLEEGGPFNQTTARRLEKHILSAGGSKEADDLYLEFRGKLPSAEALLKKRGFLAT